MMTTTPRICPCRPQRPSSRSMLCLAMLSLLQILVVNPTVCHGFSMSHSFVGRSKSGRSGSTAFVSFLVVVVVVVLGGSASTSRRKGVDAFEPTNNHCPPRSQPQHHIHHHTHHHHTRINQSLRQSVTTTRRQDHLSKSTSTLAFTPSSSTSSFSTNHHRGRRSLSTSSFLSQSQRRSSIPSTIWNHHRFDYFNPYNNKSNNNNNHHHHCRTIRHRNWNRIRNQSRSLTSRSLVLLHMSQGDNNDEAEAEQADNNNNKNNNNNPSSKNDIAKNYNIFQNAVTKFQARPGTYLLIPCVAALVGWLTNWLAVQMIFYPIQYRGLDWYRRPEVPLGFLGWQGIVPCKTRAMSATMVEMVTSQLLTVSEAFEKLNPKVVARLLVPRIPILAKDVVSDVVAAATATTTAATAAPSLAQRTVLGLGTSVFAGLDSVSQGLIDHFTFRTLVQFVQDLQHRATDVFNIQACVTTQMLADRRILGQLFQACGQAELDFLTNSGLWFGFLLGLIQMAVALVWDNPWSLSIGGGIVGLATNWLALKWIFEPVHPTPFKVFGKTLCVLQGQFLRRQPQVAAAFSAFFANTILSSDKVWDSILNDPTTKPVFGELFRKHFGGLIHRVSGGVLGAYSAALATPETVAAVTDRALERLPEHLPVVYEYMDQALDLQTTLRVKMEQMTSLQFERVLHPIFEEDELTLILAGAVLGFLAGLVQQGLETGYIQIPSPRSMWKWIQTQGGLWKKQPRAQLRRVGEQVVEGIRRPFQWRRPWPFERRRQQWQRRIGRSENTAAPDEGSGSGDAPDTPSMDDGADKT